MLDASTRVVAAAGSGLIDLHVPRVVDHMAFVALTALMLDSSTRAAAAARGGLIDLRFAPPPRFDLSQVSARLFCRPLRNINGPLSKNTFCAGRHTPTFDNKQHVYRRAARLYYAAFKLDPSKSGRKMVA